MTNFFSYIKSLFHKKKEPRASISDIQSGSIIGFNGKSAFSRAIKIATAYDISHVGIAIEIGGVMYLAESTTLTDLPDALTGKIIKGVQLHKIADRVNSYNGKVYLYPLKEKLTEEQENNLKESIIHTHSQDVQYDTIQALGSALNLGRFDVLNDKNNYKLFCSEFVCEELQDIGLLDNELNYSEYRPVDICKLDILDDRFLLN